MSRIWEPQPISVYLSWIEAIMQEVEAQEQYKGQIQSGGPLLNDWENKFVDSVQTRLLNGTNLSELQAKKLEVIYAEKTK